MGEMNRTWVLRHRPVGEIRQGDLQLEESPLAPLKDLPVA
jgi:NADPH-dependent curcumin reductase